MASEAASWLCQLQQTLLGQQLQGQSSTALQGTDNISHAAATGKAPASCLPHHALPAAKGLMLSSSIESTSIIT